MKSKTKNIIRKIIYFILFGLCIYAFIYIGNKYEDIDRDKVVVISDYYKDLKYPNYEVISGNKMISLLRNGKNIILIGSSNNEWSKSYIKELDNIFIKYEIDKVYYYDLDNDKSQKNSNYYKIIELLRGYLTTTDNNNSNLLAPSLYIIDKGKVKYYNTDTTSMKNTDKVEKYWNKENKDEFEVEISHELLNYYLNN